MTIRAASPATAVLASLALAALAACGEGEDRVPAPGAPEPAPTVSGGVNGEWARAQPYLVLVSIDGFRHDYLDRHPTPALHRLAGEGVRARALLPVFPTLTFPNHYSIATGLYPANHGIVANTFPGDGGHWYAYKDRTTVQDGRWYAGEPIWVAAERRGMVSAAYFFVGTEAPIDGISPSHWYPFDAEVPGERRVDRAIEWLSLPPATRPHVITLYFEELDVASHRYGPDSPEAAAAIANVDRHIGRLLAGIDGLPIADRVTVVIVSDHGQSSYEPDAALFALDEVVDLTKFAVVDGGPYAFLFADGASRERLVEARDAINRAFAHGRAWLKDEAPPAWRLGGDSRFPDLIVQADPRHGVVATAERAYVVTAGDHGWAPDFTDMHGIFIAAGPRLPAGRLIEPLRVVDIYPLMRELLNLPPLPTDGDPSVLLPLLEPVP